MNLPDYVSENTFLGRFLDGKVWELSDPDMAGNAVELAQSEHVSLMSCRTDSLMDLHPFGFSAIETLITLAIDPKDLFDKTSSPQLKIRRAETGDIGACRNIAGTVYRKSFASRPAH